MLLVNVDGYLKMLPIYYLYLNCREFSQKANELEMNKKKSRDAWEHKSTKNDIDTQGRKARGTRSIKSTRARRAQGT